MVSNCILGARSVPLNGWNQRITSWRLILWLLLGAQMQGDSYERNTNKNVDLQCCIRRKK